MQIPATVLKLSACFKLVSSRSWILFAGATVLLVLLGSLFNPGVQKRLVEKYLAPSFEQLSFERIHVLPWSATIAQLDLRVAQTRVQAENISARFCLSSLLAKTINLQRFTFTGGIIDLRSRVVETEATQEPFPGIFTLLDHGFGAALGRLSINALVLLNATDKARIEITAENVEPNAVGEISFKSDVKIGGDSLNIHGAIELDQLSGGRFNALSVSALAIADFSTLPQPEKTQATITLKPAVEEPGQDVENSPELFNVMLRQLGRNDATRAEILIDGIYDPRTGEIRASHQITSSDKLVSTYLVHPALPKFQQSASGEFTLDTIQRSGNLTVKNRADFTNIRALLQNSAKAPGNIGLDQEISASFTADSITLTRAQSRVEGASRDIAISTIPLPLTLAFSDPKALLTTESTLLSIDLAAIPLEWFDALLPEHNIETGSLSGSLIVQSDGAGNVVITPSEVLRFENIGIYSHEQPIVENLNIAFEPVVKITPSETSVNIPQIAISIDERVIGSLAITVAAPAAPDESERLHATIAGDLDLDSVMTIPVIESQVAEFELPKSLAVTFNAALSEAQDTLVLRSAGATLSHATGEKLFTVQTLQAINAQQSNDEQLLEFPSGPLARTTIKNFDLRWLSQFTDPLAVSGQISAADFNVSLNGEREPLVEANEALKISRLSLTNNSTPIVDNLSVSVLPIIRVTPTSTEVRYRGLRLSSGERQIASGNGSVNLTQQDTNLITKASGNFILNLANLANQPVVSQQFPEFPFDSKLSMRVRYDLSHAKEAIEAHSLDIDLLSKGRPFAELDVGSTLTIRPVLAEQESLAKHAVGEIKLSIDNLTPDILGDLFPLENLSFDTISGDALLKSDGNLLSAQSVDSIVWANVIVKDADGKLVLNPFNVATSGIVEASGKEISTNLDKFAITFTDSTKPALQGVASATIAPSETIMLKKLSAEIEGSLVQLLNQPAVIPNHSLTSGKLSSKITIEPNGDIAADTRIEGLESGAVLDINTITMPLAGNMRADGRGFNFKMPLIGVGASGTSNALTLGAYLPQPGQSALLRLKTTSELFFLNDILATVNAIKPPPSVPRNAESKRESTIRSTAVDEQADTSAYWSVLPYDTQIAFNFGRVFYSDYAAFTDIKGEVNISDLLLEIRDFEAHFHDSPLTVNGNLAFNTDSAEPYQADLVGKIENFDLNQFFSELAPTKKSRVEGLFGVDIAIAGNSPNVSEFRNKLLLDLKMTSRDGLFRTLPPDSVLLIGASDALGIIGEGLSYVPTGGFGAGAVSRLVNYIAEVEYDSVDIRITRDRSLDLQIERADLLSPEIRIATAGTIEHINGKDILDSPLELIANLNMTGKGAAILYSLDLIEEKQDDFGYWYGPEVRITGTGSNTESNFSEIIQRASDATVKGGFTRPISGIIGNIKHRWFGKDARVEDAQRDIENAATVQPPAEN
jgi:hypothetical protein